MFDQSQLGIIENVNLIVIFSLLFFEHGYLCNYTFI